MDQWEKAKSVASEITSSDLDTMLKKAHDYSTDNIHSVGAVGVASRLVDKVHRLRNLLSTKEDPKVAESIEDTLSDIRNYCIILELKRSGNWPQSIKSLYVAGPIDDAGSYKGMDGFNAAVLEVRGVSLFFPARAYYGAKCAPDFVAKVNRSAIRHSDAVLVVWEKPVPSFGTGRDVEYARQFDKRVFVVAPWCHSTELNDCLVFKSVTDAIEAIAPRTPEERLTNE